MTILDRSARPRPNRRALRRWPTLLALLAGAATAGELLDGDVLAGVGRAAAIAIPVLVYLIAATTDRPAVAWPLTAVTATAPVVLPALGIDPTVALIAMAALVLVVGLVLRARDRRPHPSATAILGALGFGTVAVGALTVAPTLGAFAVGAGLLGHVVWDVAHHRRDAVVPRSLAESCAVFDLVVGVAVLGTAVVASGW